LAGPPLNYTPVAKEQNPIVLIFGQDSLRADRALESVLKARQVEPSEIVRIWGDESSFADVFAAATSRSLFSEKTVVVVRRAEKLRGGGGKDPEDEAAGEDGPDAPEIVEEKPKGKKAAAKAQAIDLPEFDPSSTLVLIVRKVDRRFGIWKKVNKAAEVIDADYLRGRGLTMAAAAEARAMGLKLTEEVLLETVEQSGPALGRIVSEFEKMVLYQGGGGGRDVQDLVAVTSAPPLYMLSDAIMAKNKRKSLGYLDDALRQGEAGLRILATLHGTIRRLAMFRAMRAHGIPSTEAGSRLGIMPFKVMDTDRAARAWSEPEIGRALSVFAEADRRLKLSAAAAPVLTHAVVQVVGGGGA